MTNTTHPPPGFFLTAGGRILCRQCTATSKRTKSQCGAVAIRGKTKCKVHGGRSPGPKTQEGRDRIAAANTTHGRETGSVRTERKLALKRLAELENIALGAGLLGTRIAGSKRS